MLKRFWEWLLQKPYGRLNRKSFLVQVCFVILLQLTLALFLVLGVDELFSFGIFKYTIFFLYFLLWLAIIWRWFVIYVKRLHDLGLSGWWLLVIVGIGVLSSIPDLTSIPFLRAIAPFSTLVLLFLLLLWPGQKGENRFGPDPLAAKKEKPNKKNKND